MPSSILVCTFVPFLQGTNISIAHASEQELLESDDEDIDEAVSDDSEELDEHPPKRKKRI